MNLKNKVILITGAGRGTGRALAEALAAHGAIIAANDISPVNVEAVVDGICAAGGTARAYIHDVAKKVAVQAMVNTLLDEFGRIDVLVNSANVQPPAALLELDEWDLQRTFEVNTIGALLALQSVGRVMRAQGGGVIINLVKIPAGAPAAFVASRAGMAAMSQAADDELRCYGIRVYAFPDAPPVEQILELL